MLLVAGMMPTIHDNHTMPAHWCQALPWCPPLSLWVMTRATIPAINTSPPCAIGEHCGHNANPLPWCPPLSLWVMTRATIPAITTSPPCAIGEHCGHDAKLVPVIGQSVPAKPMPLPFTITIWCQHIDAKPMPVIGQSVPAKHAGGMIKKGIAYILDTAPLLVHKKISCLRVFL